MKFISRLLSLSFLLLLSTLLFAQEKTGLGSTLRSSGRIYVVIAVIVTILIGLFIYLIRLDRKIGKLEKNS